MAALCKAGEPESGFMDLTCPDVSTRASKVTFSELFAAKSGNAFGEAIARTALISFGGTMPVSSEGGTAETIAALLKGLGAERLSAMAATSGFSGTAESAPESGADLASTAFSGTARVESFVIPDPATCDASSEAALDSVAGATLVCGDLPVAAGALATF